MLSHPVTRPHTGRVQRRLLITLAIAAGTQRFSLASVPPVATLISETTGLNSFQLGLATTIAVVMIAVGSPLSAHLSHVVSRERVQALGAAAVVVGCAVRALPPASITLYIGSVLGGLGIGAVATMVPGIISERLPGVVGIAVGATTFSMTLVAVLASSLTAPLALRIGAPLAMAAWAIPALIALLVWMPFTRHTEPEHGTRAHFPWTSGTGWLCAGVLSGQSIAFLLALAWTAPSFQASGTSFQAAGFLLGTVTFGNMVGAMLAPVLTHRTGERRTLLVITLVMTAAGAAYLALGLTAFAPVAMAVFGLGLGGGFGVGLALLNDLGANPRATASLAAMCFLVAYLVGAPTPALGGWVHDTTGGFTWVWWLVVVVSMLQIPAGIALGPRRRGSVTVREAARTPAAT